MNINVPGSLPPEKPNNNPETTRKSTESKLPLPSTPKSQHSPPLSQKKVKKQSSTDPMVLLVKHINDSIDEDWKKSQAFQEIAKNLKEPIPLDMRYRFAQKFGIHIEILADKFDLYPVLCSLWSKFQLDFEKRIAKEDVLIQTELTNQYANIPLPDNATVVIITKVLGDGIGDYFHFRAVIQTLLQQKNHFTIIGMASIHEKWKTLMEDYPLPKDPRLLYHPLASHRNAIPEDDESDDFSENKLALYELTFDDKATDTIRTADAVMAVSCGRTSDTSLPQIDTYGELGVCLWDNNDNRLFTDTQLVLNTWAMGFGQGRSFFIDPNVAQYVDTNNDTATQKANSIVSTKTKQALGLKPDENVSDIYPHKRSLSICYFRNTENMLQQFLLTYSATNTSKDIDVITKTVDPNFFNTHMKPIRRELLQMGIHSIELVDDKGYATTYKLTYEETPPTGKKIRILQVMPLPQDEFTALRFLADGPNGCTGDNTLQECLTLQKLPFYENIKKANLKMVLESLENLAPEFKELRDYYFQMLQKVDCKRRLTEVDGSMINGFIKLANSTKLKQQQQIFAVKLRETSHFEKQIQAILARNYLLRKNPELKDIEVDAVENSFEGNLSQLKEYFEDLKHDA